MRFFLQRTSDAVDTADCVQPCLLVSYRPLAQRTLRALGAAGEMATFVAGQPRAWPGRPSAAREEELLGFRRPCDWHSPRLRGRDVLFTGRTVVAGR